MSEAKYPDWITTIYFYRSTCSGKRQKKTFNVAINERSLEMKPAWDLYPTLYKEYGSRCSGMVNKSTSIEKVLEKAREGWTIIKHVTVMSVGGRKDVEVEYFHIPTASPLKHVRDSDGKEYFDRVELPSGRVLKVYSNRVEEVESDG